VAEDIKLTVTRNSFRGSDARMPFHVGVVGLEYTFLISTAVSTISLGLCTQKDRRH